MSDDHTVLWAKRVSRYDPHGLTDLEDVLLAPSLPNVRRFSKAAQSAFWRRYWGRVPFLLAMIAPLYGPVGFSSGSYRGMERNVSTSEAYPVSALTFSLGIAALVFWYLKWRRNGRLRDGLALTMAVVYVVCAVITLPLAFGFSDSFRGGIVIYVIPMVVLLVLALITAVYQGMSPRPPVDETKRLKPETLTDEDREFLLNERREALGALADRGLLEGGSVEELAGRPLGELHVSTEESDDQQR